LHLHEIIAYFELSLGPNSQLSKNPGPLSFELRLNPVDFTSIKFQIMKKTLIVIALISLSVIGITSCTAQHGCKGTQGYVGYGSR
jgi:hypothetical protein